MLNANGLSLVETIIALAIAAVVAALATPSFEQQLRRARRADALVATLKVQAAQERFRSRAPSYGNLADIGLGERSEGGHYALKLAARDAHGFELLAIAAGAQWRDVACRYMRLRVRSATPSYASGPDPSLSNAESENRRCWGD